jgi:hypothetical protein
MAACQSTQMSPDKVPDRVYRRDMLVTINGKSSDGVMVVPRSSSYKIRVEGKAKIDLFTLQSCHREMLTSDIKNSGIWRTKSVVEVDYAPAPGVEDSGACPVQLGGYEKAAGRHSWALVDFESTDETLKANLFCNGDKSVGNGVSICQSRAGLIQKIVFERPVVFSPDKGCEIPESSDQTWTFAIPKGVCVYYFAEKQKPNRAHRLTTIGYEDVLVRVPGD